MLGLNFGVGLVFGETGLSCEELMKGAHCFAQRELLRGGKCLSAAGHLGLWTELGERGFPLLGSP